jgi:heme/copper-type cytochrome/quinol oxidase subunit 2
MKPQSIYWFVIAAAALAVAFAPLPFVPLAAAPASRTFRIEASQFAYSPAELQVDPGDHVTIELVSTDVAHGLYVDGYGVSAQSDPGQTARLTFIADRPGSYRFRCNVTCGAMHPFMIGRLMVGTDNTLYRGVGLALVGAIGILLFNPRRPLPGGMLV